MRLPGYAAEASLSTTQRVYRGLPNRSAAGARPTIVAQLSPCDPCDICGDGGGGQPPPPMACRVGEKCCGVIIDNRCVFGRCQPINTQCE